MEQHYVFLKENRVVQIAVFVSEDMELAARIAAENGCDNAIWVGADKPALYSLWNGASFEAPTDEYLVSIGALPPEVLIPKETIIEN